MTKMLGVTLSFLLPISGKGLLPTVDNIDVLGGVLGDLKKGGAENVQYNLYTNTGDEHVGRLERDRTEDDAAEAGGKGRTAGRDADDADDKPKRGRGRPRKSDDGNDGAEARSGSAEGGRSDGGKRAEGGKDAGRNVADRTDEGADEGDGNRAEGRRGAGGRGDAERGNREARRISSGEDRGEQDDGWGDSKSAPAAKAKNDDDWNASEEDPRLVAARASGPKSWPDDLLPCNPDDITKDVLNSLLGDHFAASGGKDRNITFDIMERATGTRRMADVEEADYPKLARALMWDAARYEFGLNK